jgi:hypothetical protein
MSLPGELRIENTLTDEEGKLGLRFETGALKVAV